VARNTSPRLSVVILPLHRLRATLHSPVIHTIHSSLRYGPRLDSESYTHPRSDRKLSYIILLSLSRDMHRFLDLPSSRLRTSALVPPNACLRTLSRPLRLPRPNTALLSRYSCFCFLFFLWCVRLMAATSISLMVFLDSICSLHHDRIFWLRIAS